MAADVAPMSTGIPDLDTIIGGGLLPGSVIALAGTPGTGKTILAQQMCFHNGTEQHPALYYTTWSEPHTKLVQHLARFEYFDPAAIGRRVELLHLPAVGAGTDSADALISELAATAFRREPSVIVIDSSKAMRGMLPPEGVRQTLWDLTSRVAHSGAVLLLVGEYTDAEIENDPEFAVADGIIRLSNDRWQLTDRRQIHVLKMRGAAPLPGVHALRISSRGISAYPRAETLVPRDISPPGAGRAGFGHAGVDAALGGGIPCGDAALLLGPSGVGKSALATAWMRTGLMAGERCLILSLQEDQPEMAVKATGLGWPEVTDALDDGRLLVRHLSPSELDLDEAAVILRDDMARQRPTRVVVDSIAELDLGGRTPATYLTYLRSLVQLIRRAGATALMTSEIATFGPDAPVNRGLSFVFQDVLVLRFVEWGDEVLRALSVFKMRTSNHDLDLTAISISARGIESAGKLRGLTGVLGWTAPRSSAPLEDGG